MDEAEQALNQDGLTNPVLNETEPIAAQRAMSDEQLNQHLLQKKASLRSQKSKGGKTVFVGSCDPKDISLSFISQILKPRNFQSKALSNSVTMTDAANHHESIVNLFMVFHQIVLVLSDLTGGVLDLPMVVAAHRYHDFEHFQSFFQAFEVFGSGYRDDIDKYLYKRIEKESHRQTAIMNLKRIQRLYQISIQQLNSVDFLVFARYSKMNSHVLKE